MRFSTPACLLPLALLLLSPRVTPAQTAEDLQEAPAVERDLGQGGGQAPGRLDAAERLQLLRMKLLSHKGRRPGETAPPDDNNPPPDDGHPPPDDQNPPPDDIRNGPARFRSLSRRQSPPAGEGSHGTRAPWSGTPEIPAPGGEAGAPGTPRSSGRRLRQARREDAGFKIERQGAQGRDLKVFPKVEGSAARGRRPDARSRSGYQRLSSGEGGGPLRANKATPVLMYKSHAAPMGKSTPVLMHPAAGHGLNKATPKLMHRAPGHGLNKATPKLMQQAPGHGLNKATPKLMHRAPGHGLNKATPKLMQH